MPGMSIHVVDVSRGVVARGMRVEVLRTEPGPLALASREAPPGWDCQPEWGAAMVPVPAALPLAA